MSDELLDLVDEKDRVIGEVWKSKANADPKLLHRELCVIIYDDKGRILFQKRSSLKKVNPSVWAESCAGHVPQGIKPLAAAHKELLEELGFDTRLRYFGKTQALLPYEAHFTYWYVGKYPGKRIRIQKEEVDKVKFLSRVQLKRLIESGEKYDPIKYGGHSEDMVAKFWEKESGWEE
jgi:isopentenyl-diphosphate delta-isomerase